jgi:hypothetical protein
MFAGTAVMALLLFVASHYDSALAWLVAVVLMAVVVDGWRTALAAHAAAGGFLAGVLATPVRRLEIALGCVAAGLALVLLAELALWLTGALSTEAVRAAERALSDARAAVERRIGPGTLLMVLAGATLLAMLLPALQPLRWFGMLSDAIGRAMLVLVTVTSFTFFGAHEISNAEPRWTASARQQIEQQREAQRRITGEIAAAVIVERHVADLPEEARAALAVYLAPAQAAARRDPSAHPGTVARALAYGAPKGAAESASPTGPSTSSRTGAEPPPDRPSVAEMEAAAAREAAETSRMETLRTAAVAAVATAVAQLVPGVDRGVVDGLVKGLVSAVANEIGLRVAPPFGSLAEARTWVAEATARARSAAPTEAAAPSEPWRWTRGDFGLDPGQLSRRAAAEAAAKATATAEARQGLVVLLTHLASTDMALAAHERAALERVTAEITRMAEAPPQAGPAAAAGDVVERALMTDRLGSETTTPEEAAQRWIDGEFAKAGASALLAGAAGLALRRTLVRSAGRVITARLPPLPRPRPPPRPVRGR